MNDHTDMPESHDHPPTPADAGASPAPTTPPGAQFAYEVARDQLAATLERISRADTKAGILVGVLIAATGAFLAIHLSPLTRIVVVVRLAASTALTAASLLLTKVMNAPNPRSVAEVVELTPEEVKTALLPILIDAYELSVRQARREDRLLRLAFSMTASPSISRMWNAAKVAFAVGCLDQSLGPRP